MHEVAKAFEGGVFAITLLSEDLAASDSFYGQTLGLAKAFGDEVSSVYMAGNTAVNILATSQADELLSPANASNANNGVQAVYTLRVADVDAVAAELESKGISLLNGPMDRPWGVRTASFRDPSGNVWEIADHK